MHLFKGSVLAILMMALCSACRAQCVNAEISNSSKALHFAGSFGLAFLGSALTGKTSHGFLGGVAVGGIKQGYDHAFKDQCGSSVEMAYSVAGAAAGAITAKAAGFTSPTTTPADAPVAATHGELPMNAIAAQNDFIDDSVQVQKMRPSGLYFLSGGGLLSLQHGQSSLGLKVSARRVRLIYTAPLSM